DRLTKKLKEAESRNAELVEALEKAKSTIAEMDNRIRQQNRNICELFDDGKALRDRIAVLDSHAMMLSNIKNNVSG
ncbi:hypothetical protein EHI05_24250, partial [Escherichia coli]|nr:hypothetical protein [Escherichia coli]EFN7553334.1 hypothetical protein [Escherichia coli]